MHILILLFVILVFGLGVGMWFRNDIAQWLNRMGENDEDK